MSSDIFSEIERSYKKNFERLDDKKFHFAARLFLWHGDEFAKNKLEQLKSEYIGKNSQEYEEKIGKILNEKHDGEHLLFKHEREKFFVKYPLLKKYNKILFRNLFCETIYGINLREIIDEKIRKEDFVKLRNDLLHDSAAIAALSTHAVNYFYTLDYYLDKEKIPFNPKLFLNISKNEKIFKDKSTSILKVYLLTHCIIGETAFYARDIRRYGDVYEEMIIELEDIINENYGDISLDNKVEFLVCSILCEKNSYLKERILSDVVAAFDVKKKYFVENKNTKTKDAFRKGEHRNVLALMAFYFERVKYTIDK